MIVVFGGNPENGGSPNSGLLETSGKLYGRKSFQNRIKRARKQTRLLPGDYGCRTGSKVLDALLVRSEMFLLRSKDRAQSIHVRFVRMGALSGKGCNRIQ